MNNVKKIACMSLAIIHSGFVIAESDDSDIFRKNVSKTPDLASNKAKMNIMSVYVPVLKADGTSLYPETNELGKPIVITYTDEIEGTGASDVFAAVSRDDGATWKRSNLSKTADNFSSAVDSYPGDSRKPVLQVRGNKMLVAWTDKYCQGGSPAYSLDEATDLYGVSGSQRSVDYDKIKDSEDLGLGVVPYSCVWASRGVVLTDDELGTDQFPSDQYTLGDVVWYKPERITSGRRDALQIFMGGAADAGFAITWQEDPAGLRPGAGAGPGTGFSGATTNHKTDIWYSYITWDDFLAMDTSEATTTDISDDKTTKPKALNKMSMPVRITDNDACNSTNMNPENGDGSHGYCTDYCAGTITIDNEQGAELDVCVTSDHRLLDGDTGASRPNLFLQKYTKSNGSTSAWAIVGYEETKGLGTGAPEEGETGQTAEEVEPDDSGKNVIYHSFDFQTPDTISAGNLVNLPQRAIEADGTVGEPIWIEGETYDVDGVGEINTGLYATENARRIRFILQGKSGALGSKIDGSYQGQGTTLIAVYKQGMEGKGRPSDIMLRRMDIYENGVVASGNPYAFKHFVCSSYIEDSDTCLEGALNMSSPTILETGESNSATDDAGEKVTYDKLESWQWLQDNLDDESWITDMTDARAHRGQIRKDFVVMGYSWTPNWAAARNGNDKYDFIIRRSRDGGVSWETTDDIWPDTSMTIDDGRHPEPRNVSLLKNHKESVVEPRIVAVPGTIGGATEGEDKQDTNIFFVSYGLEVNWKKGQDYPIDGDKPDPLPTDMYYARSTDQGYSYETVINPSSGNIEWDWLAKRQDVAEAEAQLRMTPDGSKFYATYQSESGDSIDDTSHFYGSDIWFRKVEFATEDYTEDDAEEEPVLLLRR